MILIIGKKFIITKELEKFIINIHNTSIVLSINNLVKFATLLYGISNNIASIIEKYYYIKDESSSIYLTNIDYDIAKFKVNDNIDISIDLQLVGIIYKCINYIIDNLGFISILSPYNKNYITVKSSEVDFMTDEENYIISEWLNDKEFKEIALDQISNSSKLKIINLVKYCKVNKIDSIKESISNIYSNYNGQYNDYLNFTDLYFKYKIMKESLSCNNSFLKMKYSFFKNEITEKEISELFKENNNIDNLIDFIKKNKNMIYNKESFMVDIKDELLDNYANNLKIDINKSIDVFTKLLHKSNKTLSLYLDKNIEVLFESNKFTLVIKGLYINIMYLDDLIKTCNSIEEVLKGNESSVIFDNSLLKFKLENDNVIIEYTDESKKTIVELNKSDIEFFPVTLNKILKLSPVYYGMNSSSSDYIKSNDNILIDNDTNIESVSLNNDKVPIDIWIPYTKDELDNFKNLSNLNTEDLNDIIGITSLLCNLDEDKINNNTYLVLYNYVNKFYPIEKFNISNIVTYRNKLLNTIIHIRNINNTIDMRRLIKKYSNVESVKYLIINSYLTLDVYSRWLSLLSAYLICMIIEDIESAKMVNMS